MLPFQGGDVDSSSTRATNMLRFLCWLNLHWWKSLNLDNSYKQCRICHKQVIEADSVETIAQETERIDRGGCNG